MVKTKLKPILPSLREKKRYIVFEAISNEKISNINSVSNAIFNCSQQFLGNLGVAKAGIMVLQNKFHWRRPHHPPFLGAIYFNDLPTI